MGDQFTTWNTVCRQRLAKRTEECRTTKACQRTLDRKCAGRSAFKASQTWRNQTEPNRTTLSPPNSSQTAGLIWPIRREQPTKSADKTDEIKRSKGWCTISTQMPEWCIGHPSSRFGDKRGKPEEETLLQKGREKFDIDGRVAKRETGEGRP